MWKRKRSLRGLDRLYVVSSLDIQEIVARCNDDIVTDRQKKPMRVHRLNDGSFVIMLINGGGG